MMSRFLRYLLTAFIIFGVLIFGIGFGVLAAAFHNLPNVSLLNHYHSYLATDIYDSKGGLIGEVYTQDRQPLTWDEVPANLKHALVATEDSRFYYHHGIDFVGIARAALVDLIKMRPVEGASTLTQQLVRNLFLTPQVSLIRKIKEALLAIEIERHFSKDEILLMYLNQVYFGEGAYGAQAAAQTYFGKNCKDLDLAQCALIAGLPQAPSLYDPLVNFKYGKRRQKEVLGRMVAQGYITQKQAYQAYHESLNMVSQKQAQDTLKYPYFTTYVIHKLLEKFPARLVYQGGLQVYTTLNPREQKIAQTDLRKVIQYGEKTGLRVSQGALVAVQPQTGYITAMVGGYRYDKQDQFNRAWQARRQPGSAFKIFDYTTALDNGFKPGSIILDEPICYPGSEPGKLWCPQEWDGKFWGPITVEQGYAWSRNTATVRMVSTFGIQKVIGFAHKMGIRGHLSPYLPTALGASSVSPLDMADVLATLDNQGIHVDLTSIRYIKDRNGNIIYNRRNPVRTAVVPLKVADGMISIMQDQMIQGTGTGLQIGRPACGKTGTSSDFKDAWFVGFTPQLACVVWTGNDNDSSMGYGAWGDFLSGKIWHDFMVQALKGKPVESFPVPPYPLNQGAAAAAKNKSNPSKLPKQKAVHNSKAPGADSPAANPPNTLKPAVPNPESVKSAPPRPLLPQTQKQ